MSSSRLLSSRLLLLFMAAAAVPAWPLLFLDGHFIRAVLAPPAPPALRAGCLPPQVVCGQNCTFVLQANGTVLACGEGSYGRLGQGNSDDLHVLTVISALQGRTLPPAGSLPAAPKRFLAADACGSRSAVLCSVDLCFKPSITAALPGLIRTGEYRCRVVTVPPALCGGSRLCGDPAGDVLRL